MQSDGPSRVRANAERRMANAYGANSLMRKRLGRQTWSGVPVAGGAQGSADTFEQVGIPPALGCGWADSGCQYKHIFIGHLAYVHPANVRLAFRRSCATIDT